MKNIILVIILITTTLNLQAHEGGHDTPLKQWRFVANIAPIHAEFIKYDNDEVWLMDQKHVLQTYPLSDFISDDQNYIRSRHTLIQSLNHTTTHNEVTYLNLIIVLAILGAVLLILSVFQLRKRKKIIHLSYGLIGISLLLFVSCNSTISNDDDDDDDDATIEVPANNVAILQALFEKFEGVATHSDNDYIYISSNGLPGHDMMVGINNWQQQVPISQNYTGDNSWAIPLHPKMAKHPLSTKSNLLKGAIAVAVNGIPIFNPLNNRGEDANAIGELDQWGGHCGRADDYHYHIPPVHLQEQVGEGNPIAYAVDGFPVYGETTKPLDDYLGITNPDGSYQYHTIKEYPYFIASMKGEVKLDPKTKAPENQVFPQPRTHELRPALRPLKGAEIIGFKSLGNHSYTLIYQLNLEKYIINYSWDTTDTYTYQFINPDGTSTTETYKR